MATKVSLRGAERRSNPPAAFRGLPRSPDSWRPRNDSNGVWRLLDANANRAREGLRVVEDTARFILAQPKAASELRQMRHRLDELVRKHYGTLLQHRDVENDTGRKNSSRRHSDGIPALLAANFKRCEEALRVLEEYGRVLSPKAVNQLQDLRFNVYQWEKKLLHHPS